MNNIIKIEKIIIGLFLTFEDYFIEYAGIVEPKDFIEPLHKKIYKVMLEQFKENRKFDVNILTAKLKADKKTVLYLTECIDESYGNITLIEEYIRILKEESYKRQVTLLFHKYKDNPDEFIEKVIQLPKYDIKPRQTYEVILEQTIESIYQNARFELKLKQLNSITGGFDKGELMVIGGYSSQGKSSLAIDLSIHFAKNNHKVLYCTSEMSEIEIARRQLSNLAEINILKFRKSLLMSDELDKIEKIKREISQWQYDIVRVTNIADIKREVRKFAPDIIFVDHLQNLSGYGRSRYEIVSDNITQLQNLCIAEDIGVIVLSQLHRPATGIIRRPTMSDFRGSGEIEEKASQALLVWWENKTKGTVLRRYGDPAEDYEINVIKNRDGTTGIVRVGFYPEFSKFIDLG